MGHKNEANLMLSPYRVLDLTDDKGFLCGKILGDLGADVIKVEPPGGDPSRNIGPFYHDICDPEKSLYWFAYNSNKRGITLNIHAREGKEIFNKLVKNAHFVIESFAPGYMDKIDLGYSVLSQINPRIIMTSISPFGQDGPYRDYKASDMVVWAMGGTMSLMGDPDRPPVRISFPQACLHGGATAAMGTMVAHYYREMTGKGQQVDVSILESVVWTLLQLRFHWEFEKVNPQRFGAFRIGASMGTKQQLVWRCKDGYACFLQVGGLIGVHTNRSLVEWMDSEGMASDYLRKKDWRAMDMATVTQEELDLFGKSIAQFFMTHTKAELYQGALERRIMFYPVATIADIVEDPQLRAGHFWEQVEHPELGSTITYPGPFVKTSETRLSIRHRAPLVGEHNYEVFGEELGFSSKEMDALKQSGII